MDFPFVVELLEYWLEYPPAHILLRAMAKYEGKAQSKGNWRGRRAEEMQDNDYKPENEKETVTGDVKTALGTGGARHLDCAPPHIQQAVERFKLKKRMDVPQV